MEMKKIGLLSVVVVCSFAAIVVGAAYRGTKQMEDMDFDDGQVTFQVDSAAAVAKKDDHAVSIDAKSGEENEKVHSGYVGPKMVQTPVVVRELPLQRTTTETTESELLFQSEDGNTFRINGKQENAVRIPVVDKSIFKKTKKERKYEKTGKSDLVEIPNEDNERDALPKFVQRSVKRKSSEESEEDEAVDLPTGISKVEMPKAKLVREKRDGVADELDGEMDMALLVANVEELTTNSTVL